MKTQILECVSQGELKRAVAKLVASTGSQERAGAAMGVSQSMVGMLLRGAGDIGRKIPAYFGLERRTVYVPKTKEAKSDE